MPSEPHSNTESRDGPAWRLLIVDDQEDVHTVTKLALRNKSWRGRPFVLSHAYSADEAKTAFLTGKDRFFHTAIIDVVMETDKAGLELCEFIRATCSPSMRIILRTGQAGVAPEDEVLNNYDIDYYLDKGDVTQQKLFSTVRACLRTSEDMVNLEDANISLTVKNAELARLDQFRKAVFNNIGDPDVGAVAEILHHSNTIADVSSLPMYVRRSAIALRDAAKRVQEVFRPYEFHSRAEVLMQNKKILIVLSDPPARRLVSQALVGTNASVQSAATVEEAVTKLRDGDVDLLCTDWGNVGAVAEGLRYNPGLLAMLMVSEPLFQEYGSEMMNLPIASFLVSGGLGQRKAVDPVAINELVVTTGKLLSGDIFGIEKYLAWGTSIRESRLTSSEDIANVVDRIGLYADKCQLKSRHKRNLGTLVDELMSNAVYDAPVTALSQQKYASRSRSERIDLTPDEMVTVRYGSDGNRFGLSVTDNFGRLDRDRAARYILKCLASSELQFDGTEKGMGLTYAFLAVSTLIINVSPGQRTEVIGLLNIREQQNADKRGRSFHYFRRLPH